MNDIEHYTYYPDSREVLDLVRMLHAAGLVNLSMLLERIETERAEVIDGREDELDAARDEGYESGFSDGRDDGSKAEDFARWYLKDVEGKQIVSRKIRGKVFWIITDDDYVALKNEFHSQVD